MNKFSDFTNSALTKQMGRTGGNIDSELQQDLHSFVSHISWVCWVLGKLYMMKFLATYCVGAWSNIVPDVEEACPGYGCLKNKVKVVEIIGKILEVVMFIRVAMLKIFGSDLLG